MLLLTYLSAAIAAPSESFTWVPRLRVGDIRGYTCVADEGPPTNTSIEVISKTETGFDLRFTYGELDGVVIHVSHLGNPAELRDPEGVARAWRLSELAKFEQAARERAESTDPAELASATLMIRGLLDAPTAEDVAAFELSRANVFLPVTGEPLMEQATDASVVVAHPLYRGGGPARGTVMVTRTRGPAAHVQVMLRSESGAFIDLTMKTLVLSNEPDADLRSAWIFLSGLSVEEKREIRLNRRTGWPSRIQRSITIGSPFGSKTAEQSCISARVSR